MMKPKNLTEIEAYVYELHFVEGYSPTTIRERSGKKFSTSRVNQIINQIYRKMIQ